MVTPPLHPETMAEMFPDLFRVARLPATTFAEQHAVALAKVREPMPPAACLLMAEFDAIAYARRVA